MFASNKDTVEDNNKTTIKTTTTTTTRKEEKKELGILGKSNFTSRNYKRYLPKPNKNCIGITITIHQVHFTYLHQIEKQ